MVHHDLSTVTDYFDQVMLLNGHLTAFGETSEMFTEENLQRTYGGRLSILKTGPGSGTILGVR
ncbi:ABC-type Mn2+/Zn2+ transport system ATPase subunit [Paenibacillus brasilensis]|uniref:ABC-type Mn2+/Zn2+ transport system ATPase subunit n=1 Tax=Paenibacillus brasilensis TaxID=128574 RepID=A0ABU0KTZ3_9BACL|nr:ABC-type Mn2+/Zn2+ transport system ATPase subunit [Paenibacillus brasilensis]